MLIYWNMMHCVEKPHRRDIQQAVISCSLCADQSSLSVPFGRIKIPLYEIRHRGLITQAKTNIKRRNRASFVLIQSFD